jgi:hypothetical protein
VIPYSHSIAKRNYELRKEYIIYTMGGDAIDGLGKVLAIIGGPVDMAIEVLDEILEWMFGP